MPKTKSSPLGFIHKLDRMPSRERMFDWMKKHFDAIASFYGFENVVTSVLEDSRILAPSIKAGLWDARQPIFCKTETGQEFTLRPSGVITLLRAYETHKLNDLPHPLKLFFGGESFYTVGSSQERAIHVEEERGLLMIGEEGTLAEAEIIHILWKALMMSGVEISEAQIKINATGCEACRPAFRSAFNAHFRPRVSRLCKNCKYYLKHSPTKILLCKEERCSILANHAPQILNFLCDACKKHLRGLLEFLDEVRIPYFLDHRLFYEGRWLEKFIFELVGKSTIIPPQDNAEPAGENNSALLLAVKKTGHEQESILGEGGRLSRMEELLTGRRLDAVCGTLFLDAWETFLYRKGIMPPEQKKTAVFLVQLGELAKRKSFGIMESLRSAAIESGEVLGRDSIKSQLKVAERAGAHLALIIGQKEAIDGTIIVREMDSGSQETIPQEKLVEFLKRKLKK